MARADSGTVTGQRSLLRRLVGSRWTTYIVGIEVFLGAVVGLALQFMSRGPFRGVVVGMAISLAVLVAVVSVIAVLLAAWRTLVP